MPSRSYLGGHELASAHLLRLGLFRLGLSHLGLWLLTLLPQFFPRDYGLIRRVEVVLLVHEALHDGQAEPQVAD